MAALPIVVAIALPSSLYHDADIFAGAFKIKGYPIAAKVYPNKTILNDVLIKILVHIPASVSTHPIKRPTLAPYLSTIKLDGKLTGINANIYTSETMFIVVLDKSGYAKLTYSTIDYIEIQHIAFIAVAIQKRPIIRCHT